MYVIFVCLCLTVSLGAVSGAVAVHLPVEKPDNFAHEEGCYIPSIERVLPYEEPYSPQDGTSCTQYICRENNLTSIFTCGALNIGDGCALVPGDKTQPYPDCCDSMRCNEIDDE